MYLSFEAVAISNAVKDVDDLTVPAKATHAELQADTNPIRYTMDDATNPTTSSGMILPGSGDPKLFLIEDVKRIRFIRDGSNDSTLNLHYLAGRDV